MSKLTKTKVDALTPPAKGQKYLWDAELRGFGVRTLPSGLKAFVLQYRNLDGQSRRIVLGRYGVLTVEQARSEARIRLGEIAKGGDPVVERSNARAAPTVSEICDWYLQEAESGRLLGSRRRPIKSSTLRMDRSRIERHIKPLIGNKKVRSITAPAIAEMQADIASGKSASSKGQGKGRDTIGGAGAASRSISTLHSIFEHAVRLGKVDANPARGVRRIGSKQRTRRLSVTELAAFGNAITTAADQGDNPTGLAAVVFILTTGFRLMEAQALQKQWLDRDRGCIVFPDTKSDGQIRVIGKSALRLLAKQPDLVASPYFFPSDRTKSHYKQVPDLVARLCHIARLEGVTTHVFRHTYASVAADLGYSELTIAALLGHGKRGVTQGYIHVDDLLQSAADATSEKIRQLLSPHTT
ncbi:tyrosine-type recombinase/integrase [Sphingobium sp. Leaf26]|uniref:tyrosine-type recombinase/integrase n=1 Tax=Sphingobium sp. Leaf26 TaxID=1735693 RepID=UPI0009E9D402|nr:integrase arm-type DNA-binding domain-containing protein [Sphingobium sp. Leaf26]